MLKVFILLSIISLVMSRSIFSFKNNHFKEENLHGKSYSYYIVSRRNLSSGEYLGSTGGDGRYLGSTGGEYDDNDIDNNTYNSHTTGINTNTPTNTPTNTQIISGSSGLHVLTFVTFCVLFISIYLF